MKQIISDTFNRFQMSWTHPSLLYDLGSCPTCRTQTAQEFDEMRQEREGALVVKSPGKGLSSNDFSMKCLFLPLYLHLLAV